LAIKNYTAVRSRGRNRNALPKGGKENSRWKISKISLPGGECLFSFNGGEKEIPIEKNKEAVICVQK